MSQFVIPRGNFRHLHPRSPPQPAAHFASLKWDTNPHFAFRDPIARRLPASWLLVMILSLSGKIMGPGRCGCCIFRNPVTVCSCCFLSVYNGGCFYFFFFLLDWFDKRIFFIRFIFLFSFFFSFLFFHSTYFYQHIQTAFRNILSHQPRNATTSPRK